jgi:hypothetical protein
MKQLVRAVLATALLALIVPSVATAGHVQTFHDRFDVTYPANICGVDLTVHETGVVNGNVTTDRDGHLLFQFTVADYQTWTNADGDWISVTFYGVNGKDVSVVDNPDGGYTVTVAINGVPEWFRDSAGNTISKDVGRIVFAVTFDAAGDFVSFSRVQVAGPHPEADSDFELVCDIVTTYLG